MSSCTLETNKMFGAHAFESQSSLGQVMGLQVSFQGGLPQAPRQVLLAARGIQLSIPQPRTVSIL